jgi:hypothetical protein
MNGPAAPAAGGQSQAGAEDRDDKPPRPRGLMRQSVKEPR